MNGSLSCLEGTRLVTACRKTFLHKNRYCTASRGFGRVKTANLMNNSLDCSWTILRADRLGGKNRKDYGTLRGAIVESLGLYFPGLTIQHEMDPRTM